MIIIKNLTKKFNDRVILNNINLTLPDKGLVVMFGESGSGKTTLLNCIAGIDNDLCGEIDINNTKIMGLCKENLCKYRLNSIGYVFQNFNLLNLETVYENIKLPLESIAILEQKFIKRRVNDIIKFLDLQKIKNNRVNTLSGGEKQRVAIGRAIINSPDVILCDEPTGALDEKNSKKIYEILKKISKDKLVLIATHDLEAKNYADQVVNLRDGNITSVSHRKTKIQSEKMNLFGGKILRKKPSLPLMFKIRHSINKIKLKKYRSLITNGILSLALSGIGISILLSTSLMGKINSTFSSLFNGNQISMSLIHENQNAINASYSGSKEKAEEIANSFKDDVDGIGVTYMVNFENFFKDQNDFYISNNGFKFIIQSLSCRSINDYRWIDSNYSNLTYPYKPSKLDNDQVVLGLTYVDMVNICYQLQIQRSYNALGEYLRERPLELFLEIANFSWMYDDQQIFNVCAVTETNKSCFYHYNELWNEIVFENMMRLPSDDDSEHYYPWEMYKIYYFKTKEDPGIFIDKTLYISELYDYVFERTNFNYHPGLCKIGEVCREKRVLFYLVDKYAINSSVISKLIELDSNLSSYYFVSDYGYASYASSLMSGFAKNTFLSTNSDAIDEAIDADTFSESGQNIDIKLPSNVVNGNFLNSLKGAVKFTTKKEKLISGRYAKNLNEIVISKGLANKIGVNEGKREIYFSCVNEENYLPNGHIEKLYNKVKLIVCGITNDEKMFIYHEPNWSISFFRDQIGISMFLLTPKSVIFELNDDIDANKICNRFNRLFSEYKFTNPTDEITKNSKQTLDFAMAILTVFSVVSSIISIFLLAITQMINVGESKDEIQVFRYIGINDGEIQSTFIIQALVHGLIAFLISSIEIIVVDLLINKILDNQFMINLQFNLNFLPILVIFVFSTLLTTLTSILTFKLYKTK